MSVKITKKNNLSNLLNTHDQFLEEKDLRMINFGRIRPFSVEIVPWNIRSIVSMNNSIRIHHGHNFEDEMLSQLFGFFIIGNQKLYDSIADIRTDGLPRMNSCSYDDVSFIQLLILILTHLHEWFSVIVKTSTWLPATVLQSGDLWQIFLRWESLSILFNILSKLLKVKG